MPLELFQTPKDFGSMYFILAKSELTDFLQSARTFDFQENFSLFELELSPQVKQEIRKHTPQGQLDDKKNQIRRTVYKLREVAEKFNSLPPREENSLLDEYISELTRAEKVLAEIFPELHSDTIKLNFNMFKEFLIDVRLYEDLQLKARAVEDFNRQTGILLRDLDNL